jgi:hypothetical protein
MPYSSIDDEESPELFEGDQPIAIKNIDSSYRFPSEATSCTLRDEPSVLSPSPVSQQLKGPVPLVL